MGVVQAARNVGDYDSSCADIQDLVDGVGELLVDVEGVVLHGFDLVPHLLDYLLAVLQ